MQVQGKRVVAVVGAGVSGLLACKHLAERGLDPVVFESGNRIGGVWVNGVIGSTRLQTPKSFYQFSDFPWPDSVTQTFPNHRRVAEYIESYAEAFGILPRIRFNRRVKRLEFVGEEDAAANWEEWGGSGQAFSPAGRWNLTVVDSRDASASPEVYQVDFVILCIGMFGDLPRKPDFSINEGPEVFDGKVLHSMDYAMLDPDRAARLVKGKTVTVVGFQKSALDIASEVAEINGPGHPCMLLFRRAHWAIPDSLVVFLFGNFSRFKEYMIHKPREGIILWLLATLLSPLMWIFTKLIEIYLRSKLPQKRLGIIPENSLIEQFRSRMTPTLPSRFYEAIEEGSLVLKKSRCFSFCKNGLIINDGESRKIVETDIVIFATGFKSDEKLENMFVSDYFRKCIVRSSTPLYRECIHPRIPHIAVLGYMGGSTSVLHTAEMRAKWLAHFLAGRFKLPSIKEMESDVKEWERFARRYYFNQESYRRDRVSVLLQIYCNDLLCKDMGCNPRRKRSLLAEVFAPYRPTDYRDL